ncbi:MAG: hypothetical protein ACD_21C00050G0004 [uncultured bacterium]|nr:MAG: hypothetical protein ACD_21C00050G0004 [uncultured bacterium]
MQELITCDFKQDMFFEADVDGHKIGMDASDEFGGKNKGPRPKPLILAALSGCSGMDVVSLLNKMHVSFSGLRIYVEGNLTDTAPKHYDHINVIYEISGKDLPKEEVEKAVRLSQEKYCGVIASLKQSAEVIYEIKYVEVEQGG